MASCADIGPVRVQRPGTDPGALSGAGAAMVRHHGSLDCPAGRGSACAHRLRQAMSAMPR
eukprot:scaffold6405_cov390-Prasinococcus_capsulatus_cf.AAC.3